MNILEEIVEVKKEEVKHLRKEYSLSRFWDSIFYEKKCLSLIKEISDNKNLSIIAEIKKASPSKGILIENFNHMKIAETYFEAGANGISILTDLNFFRGSLQYLKDIAAIKIKPLLRKDFVIDEFQIYEAKANGADVILLISEILSAQQIQELTYAAKEAGMEVLLELHSKSQIDKIDFLLNNLIGINNRNLENFVTDINTTLRLSEKLPENIILVSESGIHNEDDIKKLNEHNVNAVLAGEHFMKSKNIKDSLTQFKEWCSIEG